MRYQLPDTTILNDGQPFTLGPVSFPSNWLGLATTSDLSAHGIVTVPDIVVPAPTLAEAKVTAIAYINAACEGQLSTITAPYPKSEVVSWDAQYAEAAAWTVNNASPTPLISAIVAVNGATVAAQCASVLGKAAAFKTASGAIIGKRQLLSDRINVTTTADAALAVVW